jgi:hypothetical protein
LVGLEIQIFLLLPLGCWDYKHVIWVPSHPGLEGFLISLKLGSLVWKQWGNDSSYLVMFFLEERGSYELCRWRLEHGEFLVHVSYYFNIFGENE